MSETVEPTSVLVVSQRLIMFSALAKHHPSGRIYFAFKPNTKKKKRKEEKEIQLLPYWCFSCPARLKSLNGATAVIAL